MPELSTSPIPATLMEMLRVKCLETLRPALGGRH